MLFRSEAVAGTPGFRAPDPRLDRRSDIYGLGALLLCVLPATAAPALRAVAAKAMSADPAARYPNAPALLADIERFQEGLAVEAWAEPWWHRVRRFGSRSIMIKPPNVQKVKRSGEVRVGSSAAPKQRPDVLPTP